MLSKKERQKAIKIRNKKMRLRNFMFSGIDWSKVVAIAPDGTRYNHPK